MNKKKLLFILLSILIVNIVLFTSGSEILTKSLFGIPAGNIILWIGIISLQLLVYVVHNGFKKSTSLIGKMMRILMIVLIILAVLWFAIAYFLSGNVNFNFGSNTVGYLGSHKASILYWNIIYIIIIAPIVLLITYSLLSFFERKNEDQ